MNHDICSPAHHLFTVPNAAHSKLIYTSFYLNSDLHITCNSSFFFFFLLRLPQLGGMFFIRLGSVHTQTRIQFAYSTMNSIYLNYKCKTKRKKIMRYEGDDLYNCETGIH